MRTSNNTQKASAKKSGRDGDDLQHDFKSVAKRFECDESEEAFDKALSKIGKGVPASTPTAKTRKLPK